MSTMTAEREVSAMSGVNEQAKPAVCFG